MPRRLIALLGLLVVPFAALLACREEPSCQDAASSEPAPPAKVRLAWAPPGATQANYVGLATVSGVIKASPATLLQVYVVNRNAAARYLQIFDATSSSDGGLTDAGLPAASAVPSFQYLVPPEAGVDIPILPGGQSFKTGLSFGVSTAAGTYTAATAGDHDVEAVYQ